MKKVLGLINKWAGATVTWMSLASILGIGKCWVDISELGLGNYIAKEPVSFAIGCLCVELLFLMCPLLLVFSSVLKRVVDSAIDYKVVCRKLPEALSFEISDKDMASPYVNEAQAEFCTKLDEQGFKNMLNSPDIDCVNIKAGSKKGKVFLQRSFIPVDMDGNTIVIRRLSENHLSIIKKISSWFKTINAFISFSPIPDGHNRVFESISKCYAHEVPMDGVKLSDADFEYVGIVHNRRDGNKRRKVLFPWLNEKWRKGLFPRSPNKEKANLDRCIRYLFVVYIVHYANSHFVKDGQPNWNDIDLAFAAKDKRGSHKKNRFFLKDHDPIVAADSVIEIGSRLSIRGSKDSRCWLKVEQEALRLAKLKVVAWLKERQNRLDAPA